VPLTMTAVFGDDTAGQAGACGRFAFSAVRCTADGRHTRCH